tara:strand:- start:792 stop:1187 length:396 start_codon:yes stop_codon:yes gene_type:complete
MSLNFEKLPSIIKTNMPFIKDLKPYFEKHTILSAALIAGFVGATTQPFISFVTPFPKSLKNITYIVKFLTTTFIISALYGFLMKGVRLFPHLEKHYYEKLGLVRSMYHDGISGLIVQCTILFLVELKKYIN